MKPQSLATLPILSVTMDRTRLTYVATAAVGLGTTVVFIWWWNRKRKAQPPSKWRKVGELSDLIVYPVKTFGAIHVTEMECTKFGLKSGWLIDRALSIIDLEGRFFSASKFPKMVIILPSISGSVLTLRAPDMMSVSVDLAQLSGKSYHVALFRKAILARDCGEEAARWLSRFLLQKDTGLRLVYYPSGIAAACPEQIRFSLLNEASLIDLNSRLDKPVTREQLRLNFVVNGATAYEEDEWDWVKIGNVIFKYVNPCTRCILATIDPETGTKHAKAEPLKTLRSYRQVTDPQVRLVTGDSPVMGSYLELRGPNGIVRLGDPVYVGIREEQASFI